MGNARSGSTIFDIILSNAKAITGLGELRELQDLGWIRNEYCACGEKVLNCPFWSDVKKSIEDKVEIDNRQYISIVNKIESDEEFYFDYLKGDTNEDLNEYLAYNKILFKELFRISDTNAIVDSSKSPRRALYLSLLEEYDVYVLHIVRDPRAVAWSIKKPIKRNLKKGVASEMPGKPYLPTAKRWIVNTLKSLKVKKALSDEKYLRINYNDLIKNNRKALEKISETTGIDLEDIIQKIEHDGTLEPHHTVAGSRIRMKKTMHLKYDDSWKSEMPFIPKLITTILTFPFLKKFGFKCF